MSTKLTKKEQIEYHQAKVVSHMAALNRLCGKKCKCSRENLSLVCLKHGRVISSGKCPKCDGLAGVNI